MSNIEKLILYLCLIYGTMVSLLTLGGYSWFAKGDVVRGVLFLFVAVGSVVGWVGPLFPSFRERSVWMVRFVFVILVLVESYRLARLVLFPEWPPIYP